jgi:ABC-2 type transport system permease protein
MTPRLKIFSDIYYVFWRELKHFWLQKTRVVVSIFQPLVWFVLMGSTMNNLTSGVAGGAPQAAAGRVLVMQRILDGAPNYMTYVVGGIVAMTTLFGGVFGGASVVWDRRLGFLNKMMAAPISHAAIPIGKMLGVAFQTLIQVTVILLLAMCFGVRYCTGVAGVAVILAIAALFAMTMSGLSLALGARLKSMESLFALMNLATMPLIFSSPAMFPARAMPGWLLAVAAWNPVTYVLLPIRALVYKGWVWHDVGLGIGAVLAFTLVSGAIAVSQVRNSNQ